MLSKPLKELKSSVGIMIDAAVRAKPEASYDYAELYKDVNTGAVTDEQ